jgi:hypothetical protein
MIRLTELAHAAVRAVLTPKIEMREFRSEGDSTSAPRLFVVHKATSTG